MKLLYIKGFSGEIGLVNDPNKSISLAISRKVQSLLEDLSMGNYKFYVGYRAGDSINLQNVYSEKKLIHIQFMYKQCLDRKVKWDNDDINYLDLRRELVSINKKEPNTIFDVTGLGTKFIQDFNQ